MNTNLCVGRFSRTLQAVVLAGCGLGACTTQEATPDGGGGGSGGGSAGTGGGTGGTGGSGQYATNDGVPCPLPAQALITDFTYMPGDGGAATTEIPFGDATTTLSGGQFVYPTAGTYPVTSNVTASNWHLTGTLGDYSGFGIYFTSCTRADASAYRGISFTISGTVPQGNMITMGIGTLGNIIASSWLNDGRGGDGTTKPGRCVPVSGTNQYDQPTCADSTKTIPVTTAPTVQNVLWGDFVGGKPEPGVTASDIVTIYWFFPPPAGAGTATPTTYDVDIVIDDLKFIAP